MTFQLSSSQKAFLPEIGLKPSAAPSLTTNAEVWGMVSLGAVVTMSSPGTDMKP